MTTGNPILPAAVRRRPLSEAQRRQRALYKAQMQNPPKGERASSSPAGVAFALRAATGLAVTR